LAITRLAAGKKDKQIRNKYFKLLAFGFPLQKNRTLSTFSLGKLFNRFLESFDKELAGQQDWG
jgi:hypothetical protein